MKKLVIKNFLAMKFTTQHVHYQYYYRIRVVTFSTRKIWILKKSYEIFIQSWDPDSSKNGGWEGRYAALPSTRSPTLNPFTPSPTWHSPSQSE